jgi:hypothetical protein
MAPPCSSRLCTEAGDNVSRYAGSVATRNRLAGTCRRIGSITSEPREIARGALLVAHVAVGLRIRRRRALAVDQMSDVVEQSGGYLRRAGRLALGQGCALQGMLELRYRLAAILPLAHAPQDLEELINRRHRPTLMQRLGAASGGGKQGGTTLITVGQRRISSSPSAALAAPPFSSPIRCLYSETSNRARTDSPTYAFLRFSAGTNRNSRAARKQPRTLV